MVGMVEKIETLALVGKGGRGGTRVKRKEVVLNENELRVASTMDE